VEEALADLAARWRFARRAALRGALPATAAAEEGDDGLLARAIGEKHPEIERKVFDNSLKLGTGFSHFFDREVPLGELPSLLSRMGVPCLHGAWSEAQGGGARVLERGGCPAAGAEACGWWREAISGLTLGVTGGVLHARHQSVGSGGARCVDVFYLDPESPLRFGPIPDEMGEGLAEVSRVARAFDSTVNVEFLGVSEGVLFYQIHQPGCGGGVSVSSGVERGLRRKFPGLGLREVSPRPVLDEQAAFQAR